MTRQLSTTPRKDLRDGAGANTHFCFNPSVYAQGTDPNKAIVQDIIDLGVGYVRERWWPKNVAQRAAFTTLTNAGVELYLFIGDITYSPAQAQADVTALAQSPFTHSLAAVCGPNEPNSHGGSTWPGNVVDIQQAIFNGVTDDSRFPSSVPVVGTALKHNVANIDADYQALGAAGVRRWCNAGDFHFYPGNAGPYLNAGEAVRAGQAYGDLSMWHSETGWTGDDTDPAMAGRYSVEALLRNHLHNIVGTILYEFADESQYVQGREGVFGLMKPTVPKPAYTMVQTLLATKDGNEPFKGWLGTSAKGVESDVGAVVTSEGGGKWTVYLMRGEQDTVTIYVPPGHDGAQHYTVQLNDSITIVHVTD